MSKNKKETNNKNSEHSKSHRRWVITITILSFTLSVVMSFLSDLFLSHANIIFMFIILFLIIFIGILFDILGVATTVADARPFNAMASDRVKGAKSALYLIKHASRVSSFCCDIIGDTCGIVSGVSAAYIVVAVTSLAGDWLSSTVFSLILSGLVAALTIGGKAMGKDFAINNSKNILIKCGKAASIVLERKNRK